ILLIIYFFTPVVVQAQAVYQPYSYHFYQKLNKVQYSIDTRQHTSIKPFIIDSIIQPVYDSLMNVGVRNQDTWLKRKLFNEHFIDQRQANSHFYADILPDLYIGRDFAGGGSSTFLRTIGAQLGGTIQDKFSYHFSAYHNRGVFSIYINDFIDRTKVVPGQSYGDVGNRVQNWSYLTAVASYTPSKYLNISLAYDKNFIGDGYRSMLLSDVASNYTSLKLVGKLGNVNYM